MMSMTVLALVVVGFLLVQRMVEAAGPRPFSVHELLAMERISEPQASPDGRRIVFTLRVTDLEANKGVTDLWLVHADGQNLRRLTRHPAGSHQPRWAPDGRTIHFLSGRSGSSQVWSIPVDGGEAAQATNLPLDVGALAISPDGTHLAVSIEVFLDLDRPQDTKSRLDELAKRKAGGRVFDRLFVRHWDAWKDGRRSHLFVLPLAGGDPIDVMKGMDADVPSKPFGGPEEFTFTPDGRALVFSARNVGQAEAWSTQFDLFLVPRDGSAPPKLLTPGNQATITHPLFAPDGRTLAYLAMTRPQYESDRFRIVVRPWPEGEPRVLTEAWDRSPGKIAWSADSRTLYACADDLGQRPLFAIDAAGGQVRTLASEGRVTEIAPTAERVVFGRCHLRSPLELYSVRLDGGDVQPVTRINAGRLAEVRMGEPEPFTFPGWNGETVHAYVVKPADFDPSRKYPVAFLIHGGPQGSFGNDFHYRWNPQVYAGAGYAAVMVDFHGSTGYGQAFTDAINGHWGDRPLEDLQKGLAAALARYPWLDGQRVAALGASYGGYMVNWLHGVWSQPFRCLVCHDGNIDERMAYYDTDELWFPEWERGGPPWERPEAYTAHNPIDHIGAWRLPTLVIHGGRDYRVVDAQGIGTFNALQRRGIPSRLLYFPDENHWVLKPANSILWHETVLGWLERWIGGDQRGT